MTVSDALATILSQIAPLGTERVFLSQALGRTLADDIRSSYDIPPLDNSAMDGYAVRHADLQGAAGNHPVRLTVIGTLPAGSSEHIPVHQGQAVRIMTGAPVPPGADTVIRQEDARAEEDCVAILSAPPPGTHIRRAGEDIRRGALLFRPGTRLREAHIGVLASVKRACISVYQRPRVAILSTGDELVDVDEELGSGKIVSSNSYSLAALVRSSGGIPLSLGIARDSKGALKERLQQGLAADMILSSGGVSVGDFDLVKEVLSDIGFSMKFWKVAMRPGQPLAFGTIAGKPTFGLPGNPVSAMVSFEQFVRPSLRKMQGLKTLFRPRLQAVAGETVLGGAGKTYFIRCRITERAGRYQVTTTGEQGSGILMSMAEANGLMIIPETCDAVQAGDEVAVQVLDGEFGFSEAAPY
jgi:molybdopterin molybdotransferase